MHTWEKKPVLFLALATVAILVGTLATMVLPFAWVNTGKDAVAGVVPYTPLQLAGRDVYIREGCNNCHTQTVRPLVADVTRYGPPSQSGEFVYDRPHLWGSRRMGPDLARVGGKYPDSWHYHHMEAPAAMVPQTNMPAYAFLTARPVDPALTGKKMDVLGFPYAPDQIQALQGKNEMDALVAYLQKLGADTGWRQAQAAAAAAKPAAELKNPFGPEPAVLEEGKALFAENCAACHGANLEGSVGPELTGLEGRDEAELYQDVHNGIPAGGMPSFAALGRERIWKIVTYVKHFKAGT